MGTAIQPVFTIQNGIATPVSIDVSRGLTYLTLFATGDIPTLSNVGGYGGVTFPAGSQVTYIGPDPSVPGVEQINLLLSPTLAGSGYVRFSNAYVVVK